MASVCAMRPMPLPPMLFAMVPSKTSTREGLRKLLTNSTLSRITDTEMKQIMIYASERIEMLLRLKEESADEYTKLVKGYNWMYCNDWQR